jgi:hypothetical protein
MRSTVWGGDLIDTLDDHRSDRRALPRWSETPRRHRDDRTRYCFSRSTLKATTGVEALQLERSDRLYVDEVIDRREHALRPVEGTPGIR